MIKVCHITTAHPRYDVRIFVKECISLAERYETGLIVADGKGNENVNRVEISDIGTYNGRLSRFVGGMFAVVGRARKINADLYHFHDTELIFAGFILKLLGKKVIYDIHEDLPKDILTKSYIKGAVLRRLLSLTVSFFERVGDYCFSGIVTATPDIMKRFRNKNAAVIKNFPVLKLILDTPAATVNDNRRKIIYAGGLTRIRGIKEIVDAMESLDGAVLWLLGNWESEEFKEFCISSKGWKNVEYLGSRKLHEVYSYMKAADIGITALHPVPGYLNSLPIKSYEYIACGLPVIMSDFPYWRETYKDAVIYVNPLDTANIADAIKMVLTAEGVSVSLQQKGREVMTKETFWEAEEVKLKALYQRILGN